MNFTAELEGLWVLGRGFHPETCDLALQHRLTRPAASRDHPYWVADKKRRNAGSENNLTVE